MIMFGFTSFSDCIFTFIIFFKSFSTTARLNIIAGQAVLPAMLNSQFVLGYWITVHENFNVTLLPGALFLSLQKCQKRYHLFPELEISRFLIVTTPKLNKIYSNECDAKCLENF